MSSLTHPPKRDSTNPSKVIKVLFIDVRENHGNTQSKKKKPWSDQCVDSVQENPESQKRRHYSHQTQCTGSHPPTSQSPKAVHFIRTQSKTFQDKSIHGMMKLPEYTIEATLRDQQSQESDRENRRWKHRQ